MQVIASWTGGHADLLRQSLRMTNESFAEYLGVAVRTVAYWRKRPETIPKPAIQETLDAALERAPDRAKAQFALLAEHGKRPDRADSPEIPDPHAFVPAASPPPAAQVIPRQRIPPDDIDDLLAHVTVTSIGEDAIEQIEQATIALAESHTQAPARKLLNQVLPLHQRVRSLLGEDSGSHSNANCTGSNPCCCRTLACCWGTSTRTLLPSDTAWRGLPSRGKQGLIRQWP